MRRELVSTAREIGKTGTEVAAFLGPTEALQRWKNQLQSLVVFSLTPDLGLVPATGAFLQELRRRRRPPTGSDDEVAESWGMEASKGCTMVYFTSFESGEQGEDSVVVWTH